MALLRFAIPLLLIGAVLWWMTRARSTVTEKTCATCRHCRKAFEDGTLCTFGEREVFKKPVHVQNCTDWQQRA